MELCFLTCCFELYFDLSNCHWCSQIHQSFSNYLWSLQLHLNRGNLIHCSQLQTIFPSKRFSNYMFDKQHNFFCNFDNFCQKQVKMLLVRNDLGTPYPIKLINPDTGNLKFKFEILQGGENFQDESNNHNQGKIGGLTFLFLFTALIGLCNRYSRPSTNHTFFISDLVWLRIIRKVYLHLKFLF